MAIYLKWHMCPYHEPLVAQISICSDTLGRAEYSGCVIVKGVSLCEFKLIKLSFQ